MVATAGTFPDALAASALAAEIGGPILLTPGDQLDPLVAEELTRLGVTRVFLVGGTAALSDAVEQDLVDRRFDVARLSGADRYETSAAIADQVVAEGGPGGLGRGGPGRRVPRRAGGRQPRHHVADPDPARARGRRARRPRAPRWSGSRRS